MVEVNLWSGMRRFVGDELVVEVEAETIGEMLDALVAAHPALEPIIEQGVSVAVDGEIHVGRHVPIPPGVEVYLMNRLKGG